MTRSPAPAARTGGEVLVDALVAHGATHVFCVPGESYLPALDALRARADRITTIVCRHEAAAANMAEAAAKLTGRPHVVFATRGPGACHAAIGIHTAFQDSTPVLLLLGQVERAARGREGFQEFDVERLFGWTAKWAAEVTDAARLPELLARAFHLMQAGRPGPVVLSLPEDVLAEGVSVADVPPVRPTAIRPAAQDIDALAHRLARAQRPLVVVGGGGWTPVAAAAVTRFAEAWDLPVAASFRCQDIVAPGSPAHVGELGTGTDPALAARVRQADLLLVLGARLGEITTQGYELVAAPVPAQALVHVHPDVGEIGRVYQPELGLVASMPALAAALAALPPPADPPWASWRAAARADHERAAVPATAPGALDLGQLLRLLIQRLPPDTVMVNDAGNFSGWVQRFWPYGAYRSQLAPTSGAMGYAVPAAIAAALVVPDRRVCAFVGDGGFLMSGAEIATALQYGAAPLILVVDNGMYGTIRMHQERRYPGHPFATDLRNPDFAAFARSFGAFGRHVAATADLPPALDEALAAIAAGTPALLSLALDPEAITTRTTLSALRAAARG